jgi:hypothetical protein
MRRESFAELLRGNAERKPWKPRWKTSRWKPYETAHFALTSDANRLAPTRGRACVHPRRRSTVRARFVHGRSTGVNRRKIADVELGRPTPAPRRQCSETLPALPWRFVSRLYTKSRALPVSAAGAWLRYVSPQPLGPAGHSGCTPSW